MRKYPKIETLWKRDEQTGKVIPNELRCEEFGNVRRWRVTEKIDGTNIRIGLNPDGTLAIGGRTDRAILLSTTTVPTPLLAHLMATFPAEKVREKFPDNTDFTIFGEGYGPKIQNGGTYSTTPRFRVFDVQVGNWWLRPDDVAGIAAAFGVPTVPCCCHIDAGLWPRAVDDLKLLLRETGQSIVAAEDGGTGCQAEGVVATSDPLLLNRRGDRVMWKLKFKDF